MNDHRRLLVLDGDPRPELARRGVVLRPGQGALPLPVRESAAVRGILADVARSGADVVTAMTGDLHHRMLSRIGASRRVREWLEEAVELARDAASKAEDEERTGMSAGRRIRVAGLVGPLEGTAGPEAAPDFEVAGAEHRAHAALLGDTGVDVLRVEAIDTVAESEAATLAAREIGLETWTGVVVDATGLRLPSGEPVSTWIGAVAPLEPAALLLSAPSWTATEAALSAAAEGLRSLGLGGSIALGAALPLETSGMGSAVLGSGRGDDEAGHGDETTDETTGGEGLGAGQASGTARARGGDLADAARRLVASGAALLSAGPDGSPARVAALRAAAEAADATRRADRATRHERIRAWLAAAAARAGRGRALLVAESGGDGGTGASVRTGAWTGSVDGETDWTDRTLLPSGFAWDVVEPARLRDLPAERYRLAVVTARRGTEPLDRDGLAWLVDTLEPGAWLLVEDADAVRLPALDERLADLQPLPDVPGIGESWLARRRP